MNEEFDVPFKKLTGHAPFPWQRDLYARFFREGKFPESCNIPTGLGKTSVIAIWLIALANKKPVPRRLVYVVNRRTVVDQTTTEVESYKATPPKGIESLAVSTLRGQFADNREWSADPSRPAVICGTVDMIGSRLLFSGYGLGFKTKPLHAGFLGQDVLLVHDEAHLEPAFQQLLLAIQKEQARCHEFGKFHVMELTATSRGSGEVFGLTETDKADATVLSRINAKKAIHLEPLVDPKKLAEQLTHKALEYKDKKRAILVFTTTVEDVVKIREKLPKDRVLVLTGTMRGKERDELVNHPIFKRFLPGGQSDDETAYLVCTAAGEVGVNISADDLVCDLSTFENMAQRLGRVNRFGGRSDTQVHIIHPTMFDDKDIREQRRQKTLDLLQELKGDGSPEALGKLDPVKRQEAFAPEPTILPVSDILFDAWALTSIEDDLPGRPEVGPYLHGLADDLPQTTIAWREELDLLQDDSKPEAAFKAIFGKHGIRPHESLTVPSHKVKEFLKEVLKAKPALGETRVVLLLSRGVKCMTVDELIGGDRILFAERTLVFPSTFGGLDERGMLAVPKKGDTPAESLDIADVAGYEPDRTLPTRQRVVIERVADGWQVKRLLGATELPDEWNLDAASSTQLIRSLQRQSGLKVRLVCTLAVDEDGDAKESLVCLSPVPKAAAPKEQTLEEHVAAVEKDAARLASLLFAEQPGLAAALRFAAKWHDEGKKAPRWQRYIGGKKNEPPIGKAAEWRDPKILSGYRHEFGSLLRIPNEDAAQLGDMLDLALHLIATHHGSGRPHFAEPWDDEHPPDKCARIHEEVIRRFSRLQRQYGRWGLAYLESLLRAADIAASRAIGIDPEVDTDDTEGGAE